MSDTAVDTSIAVPLLVASHTAHPIVSAWARGRTLVLSGHALVETYSVLTRLPGEAKVAPRDAVVLIDDTFEDAAVLHEAMSGQIHRDLANRGVGGGAAYDGLVGAAARDHDLTLVTRDARARGTYEAVGAQVELIGA